MFEDIHIKIYIKIDVSISIRPTTSRFGKQVHLQDLTEMSLIRHVLVTSLRQDHVKNKSIIYPLA